MPVSDAAHGFHPFGPPALVRALQHAAFAQQGNVPVAGSRPGVAAALSLAADSVMKHGFQVHLSAVAEDPVRTLTAVPATLCKDVHITITASSFTIQQSIIKLLLCKPQISNICGFSFASVLKIMVQ